MQRRLANLDRHAADGLRHRLLRLARQARWPSDARAALLLGLLGLLLTGARGALQLQAPQRQAGVSVGCEEGRSVPDAATLQNSGKRRRKGAQPAASLRFPLTAASVAPAAAPLHRRRPRPPAGACRPSARSAAPRRPPGPAPAGGSRGGPGRAPPRRAPLGCAAGGCLLVGAMAAEGAGW